MATRLPVEENSGDENIFHSKELQNKYFSFIEEGQKYIGSAVNIRGALSISKDNFDRHLAAYCHLKFTLEQLRPRFSGNKLMILGEDCDYELHRDAIVSVNRLEARKYAILERLSETVYRQTEIEFVVPRNE